MGRLASLGLTLNEDKCKLGLQSLSYLGHTVSDKGVSIDYRKVEAIQNAVEPENISELRGFLGLVNFVGKFVGLGIWV